MPHGFAVEEPITSYFRRVSVTSNHKQNSHLVPSTAKRQRTLSGQAEDAKQPKKPRTRQKLAPSSTSRKTTEASHGKTRISTSKKGSLGAARTASHASPLSSSTPLVENQHLPLSSDTGSTNNDIPADLEVKSSSVIRQATDGGSSSRHFNGVKDGRKQYGSLQTPPPTILPRRKYSTFSRHVQPIPLTAAVSRPSPCLSEASLPTPITIARSILSSGSAWREPLPSNLAGADMSAPPHTSNPIFAQPHGQISASGGNQISGSSRERGRDQERNDDNDLFADPSAFQMLVLSSQTQDADNQPLQALTDLSTVGPIFRVPPLPGRNLSRNILVVGDSDSDSDGFIQSSQSQHILPHHISPRRKCAGQLLDSVRSSLVDESTLEEVVPSSQSQTELELNMFMRISDYLPHYTSGVRAGQSESSSHRNDLPSAGWSPAAILHDELSHVPNQDMILSNEDTTDDFVLAPVDSLGSATEDESEDEFSIRRTHGTASTRILSVRTLDAVTLSDEVLEETAEYINSLPHTVQDFEVMFGESSGSLPGDFPMSLR